MADGTMIRMPTFSPRLGSKKFFDRYGSGLAGGVPVTNTVALGPPGTVTTSALAPTCPPSCAVAMAVPVASVTPLAGAIEPLPVRTDHVTGWFGTGVPQELYTTAVS